jgi:CBS domain-containing protein
VEWVGPDMSIKHSAMKMRDAKIGCLPVEQDGKLLGMVTDRDITCRSVADGKDAEATKVRDIMSMDVTTCYDDVEITDATSLMEKKGVARLPVIDHDNHLVGLLSLGDVSTHCAHELAGEVMSKVAKFHH